MAGIKENIKVDLYRLLYKSDKALCYLALVMEAFPANNIEVVHVIFSLFQWE